MSLKLMDKSTTELDLYYQMRVSLLYMHNFIFMTLIMRWKIEYQFLIGIGIVRVRMKLIEQLSRA
jgi:hypothetical protein